MITRNLLKLATDLEKLNSIDKLIDELEFEKAQHRTLKYLSVIDSENRIRIFGTTDSMIILDELSYQGDKARDCDEWLQTEIGILISSEMSLKTAQHQTNRICELYSDDPRKTMNNYTLNKVQLQCLIDEHMLYDYFANANKRNEEEFIPDDDGIFALTNCFADQDRELFISSITDDNSFTDVINSRKFDSAAGPDGVDYSIFKLSPSKAAKYFSLISKIIVKVCKVPQSLKKSIMGLLFKKGEVNEPGNWRPISISNCI